MTPAAQLPHGRPYGRRRDVELRGLFEQSQKRRVNDAYGSRFEAAALPLCYKRNLFSGN